MKPIFEGTDWTFDDIQRMYEAVEKIGVGELGLNIYPNVLEIIGATQMLDAYSSIGLPKMYPHWSFGKHFARDEALYRKGYQGLAYEIVINSDPCISYLMENNSAPMQCLVIAHAAMGHNHVFKNNYLFKQWTDAGSIIDYLSFAKDYVTKCEQKYGYDEVEEVLDTAHALMEHGVFRYKRPGRPNRKKHIEKMKARERANEEDENELWRMLPKRGLSVDYETIGTDGFPEENLLYFIEKKGPKLKTWQRELVRIVRMTSQYLYPQRQTQVLNEGAATYVHHKILTTMHERGLITDGAMLECLDVHTAVVYQPGFDNKHFSGINPYALGFNMMRDIERICEDPTDEDREWFPDIAGKGDHMEVLKDAWANYRDESLITQFLSPKLMRDMRLFNIYDDTDDSIYRVTDIHDRNGYEAVRRNLSSQYDIGRRSLDIQVTGLDDRDRTLHLSHFIKDDVMIEPENGAAVLEMIEDLWGYPVELHEIKEDDQ